MDSWPVRQLGDVVDLQTGYPFKSEQYVDDEGAIRLLRGDNIAQGTLRWNNFKRWPSDATNGLSAYLLRKDDVVLAMDRPWIEAGLKYASVRRLDLPALLVQRVARLRGSEHIDTKFLKYVIGSREFTNHVLAVQTGTAVPHISALQINSFELKLPPLHEQRSMASVLAVLDDKIELNRRMNETLEAMARAIFRDWFVDFGPTRARQEAGSGGAATGNSKNAGREPYLVPDLWALFPDRLDADGTPTGWEVGALSDVASLNPESWSARNQPDAVRYVDLSNTKWGVIEGIEVYPWKDAPSRARRVLRSGDTIVGTVRPGNGSFALISEDGLTGSTGFAVLRPKDKRDHELVWCAATSPENIERLSHLADGAAYPAVRPGIVADTELMVADEATRRAFSSQLGPLLDKCQLNLSESRTLAATRDLLLPRLMSGEVRVGEAAELTDEAVARGPQLEAGAL